MPEVDGFELVQQIKRVSSEAVILMLTSGRAHGDLAVPGDGRCGVLRNRFGVRAADGYREGDHAPMSP